MKQKRNVTLSGLIRKRLADYDKRMFEGVRQSVFVSELEQEGYSVSLSDFRVLLCRARKRTSKTLGTPDLAIKKEAGNIENNASIVQSTVPDEKNTEKLNQTTTPARKKLSQQDIGNILNQSIDLDNLV